MNWEAAGAIGEIIGAIAVVATIAYLARQLSANTSSNQGIAIAHIITEGREQLIRDKDLADVFVRGAANFEDLDANDRLIFSHYVTGMFTFWLSGHYQYERKLLPGDLWIGYAGDIAGFCQHKGTREVWETIAPGFPAKFQTFVEDSIKSSLPVDYSGVSVPKPEE